MIARLTMTGLRGHGVPPFRRQCRKLENRDFEAEGHFSTSAFAANMSKAQPIGVLGRP